MIKVHFLWWEGCPSHPDAWQRLQDVLADLQVDVDVESIEVTTDEQADSWHFPGSPTIQVNGEDVDPNAIDQPARLTCRLYFKEDGRPSPLPSEAMIKRAILTAAQQ